VTPALEVRDVDVLFFSNVNASNYSQTRILSPRPFDEPPGFHVGLANVNCSVESGQCLAVLGASGGGKSSLLKSLAGLHVMRRGQILVNGRDVTALPPEQRSIVYLHQEPVLFPHLSVMENVAFPLTLRGVQKRDASRRAIEWLDKLQVANVSYNAADALSGGQRHRVALARALCAEPAVLLLDEPLASLDPAVRRDVRAALLDARAACGAAMILVTHDLDDALAIATQMSLIDWMSLTPPQRPAAVVQAPPSLEAARLVGVFAEINGDVFEDGGERRFQWIGGTIAVTDVTPGPAVACVRSHEVIVTRVGVDTAPALTVADRRDSAHDVSLTLRDARGDTVTLRTGSDTSAVPGERVCVTIAHARVFSSPSASRVTSLGAAELL
jgi:ABC-type sulfate/molybdate transport systems ATPase subunit